MRMRVEVSWRYLNLEVIGDYSPGRAGTMYRSNGDPGDPPEPEDFEIEDICIIPNTRDDSGRIGIYDFTTETLVKKPTGDDKPRYAFDEIFDLAIEKAYDQYNAGFTYEED